MDETLVELLACHPSGYSFEGTPPDAFCALIGDKEYGPNVMPETIGLYRGQYTIVFHPGEL